MATAGTIPSSYKSEDLLNGAHFKVGIVVSTWNQTYTGGMLEGARAVLIEAGVPQEAIAVHWVPGSYELPLGRNGSPNVKTSTASFASDR